MAFKKIEILRTNATKHHAAKCKVRIFFAAVTEVKNKHGKGWQCATLYVHRDAVEQLRWVKGDKLSFEFDEDTGRIALYRDLKGAATVTLHSQKATKTGPWKIHVAKVVTDILRKAWNIDAGKFCSVYCESEIDGAHIVLTKKEVVS
jgi:hypothetical protein